MPYFSAAKALRKLRRLLILFVLLPYATICALLYALQNSLLYQAEDSAPSAQTLQQTGWQAWKGSDGELRGYLRQPQGSPVGTIVLFHGNAGSAFDRRFFADALLPLGYRVILAEYPGYGGRNGTPGEALFVADAKVTLELAHRDFGTPLMVWGESLGAGVAAAASVNSLVPIQGLALLTPWDSLANAAQGHYWYLPVAWLLRDRYDSSANLQTFKGRLAILVAEADRTIPPQLAMRLFAAHPGDKKLWSFAGADHNSWPSDADLPWWGEVMRYLNDDLSKLAK